MKNGSSISGKNGIVGRSLLAVTLVAAKAAIAAPPAPNTDDARIMEPFKEWIMTRTDQYRIPCCDIGDGRPVDADIVTTVDQDRVRRTHWRAHVTPTHFPDQRDHWMEVPDDKIVPGANPTGTPILWLYNGLVQCFAPPDAF